MIMTYYQKQSQTSDLREIKQIIYHSEGIHKNCPKMYFLLNLSHCLKRCGHFCQILFFYNARSLNMVMSRDPRCRVRNFLFCPNFIFNITKSHKISSGKALYFRSYQPKNFTGGGGGKGGGGRE